MLPMNKNDTFIDSYMTKFVVMPTSLNLIVKAVLEELSEVIIKIRDSVK